MGTRGMRAGSCEARHTCIRAAVAERHLDGRPMVSLLEERDDHKEAALDGSHSQPSAQPVPPRLRALPAASRTVEHGVDGLRRQATGAR